MNELYEELETPEGERKKSRLAKARDKATKDFSHTKQIKNRIWCGGFKTSGYDHRKREGLF